MISHEKANQIEWIMQAPPADRPSCGFHGEDCNDGNSDDTVTAFILAILLVCSFIVIGTVYRKWKIEMEIEGLLWKIDINDLVGYYGNELVSSTKVSFSNMKQFSNNFLENF